MKNGINCEEIAELLRAELEVYGGLLQLFDDQQARIFARDSDAVPVIARQIENDLATASVRRTARENAVRRTAALLGRETTAPLGRLLGELPEERRPQLDALIKETTRMVRCVRQRARQNQMLLARMLELHRAILPSVRPNEFTQTYSPQGRVRVGTSRIGAGYRAEG